MYAINDFAVGNTPSSFSDIESSVKMLAGDFNDVPESQIMTGFGRYWRNPVSSQPDARSWPAVNPTVAIVHILTFKGQCWQTERLLLPVAKQPQLKKIRRAEVSDHLPLVMTLKRKCTA